MKSAAFNIAFKVHRNELPFAEGLLKAVETNAQEDFIVALNSLAGETKYDIDKLDSLIEEARQGIASDSQKSEKKIDLKAVEEEINQLKKKRSEYKDSVETYRNQIAALVPTLIPGINSLLLSLVGIMIAVLFFLLNLVLFALLILLGTFATAGFLLYQDMENLRKQKEDIARKKARYKEEITKIESMLDELEDKLQEQQRIYNEAKGTEQPPEQQDDSASVNPSNSST